MSKEKICNNCKFHAHYSSECKRHSPMVSLKQEFGHRWPVVMHEEYCGDWEDISG